MAIPTYSIIFRFDTATKEIQSYAEHKLFEDYKRFISLPNSENWNEMMVSMLRYQQASYMVVGPEDIGKMFDDMIQKRSLGGQSYKQVLEETYQIKE